MLDYVEFTFPPPAPPAITPLALTSSSTSSSMGADLGPPPAEEPVVADLAGVKFDPDQPDF